MLNLQHVKSVAASKGDQVMICKTEFKIDRSQTADIFLKVGQ